MARLRPPNTLRSTCSYCKRRDWGFLGSCLTGTGIAMFRKRSEFANAEDLEEFRVLANFNLSKYEKKKVGPFSLHFNFSPVIFQNPDGAVRLLFADVLKLFSASRKGEWVPGSICCPRWRTFLEEGQMGKWSVRKTRTHAGGDCARHSARIWSHLRVRLAADGRV